MAALVYIAAFAPDAGESVSTLIANPPPGAPVPPILPPQDGFLFLDRAQFPASFAADVSADLAAFMADAQVPWGVGRPERRDQRAGVAEQAELVPRRDRGPDDPPAGAAGDGDAGGGDGGRGRGQPRDLRVAAGRRGVPHRAGRCTECDRPRSPAEPCPHWPPFVAATAHRCPSPIILAPAPAGSAPRRRSSLARGRATLAPSCERCLSPTRGPCEEDRR